MKIKAVSFCLVLFFLIFLEGCERKEHCQMSDADLQDSAVIVQEEEVYVHVCGAVKKPGVYALSYGSRVFEAIEAAGGFRKNAAVGEINQALLLEDEMQIIVPKKKNEKDNMETGDKVNINTANIDELMTLTGVGESKAQAIIDFRTENGLFKKIEDIMNVNGIKEGMFSKIKDYITV